MIKIREFVFQQDLQTVLELWHKSDPGIQLSPSDAPDEIWKKLDRDPDLFLVAEEESHIVGAVMGGFDGRRGMIYHLVVAPSHQRKGIGRILMSEVEHRLQHKGCLKYYLLVTKDNRRAISFYESVGCEVMNLYVMGKVIQ